MKRLLFDQNLSPSLVDRPADIYPESIHVQEVGLGNALDVAVWEYARQNGCIIVTKDADFTELSVVCGSPPQVVWICRGNCSTNDNEGLLRDNYSFISSVSQDPETGILTLF